MDLCSNRNFTPLIRQSTPITIRHTEQEARVETCSFDFDPNDGFDEVIAHIEQYDSPKPASIDKPPTDHTRSLMPNSTFSSCTFNFSINYNH